MNTTPKNPSSRSADLERNCDAFGTHDGTALVLDWIESQAFPIPASARWCRGCHRYPERAATRTSARRAGPE